ncbi:hypothetical protein GCM10010253_40030 [Streptomyces badius]|uniref:Transposase DDE domain-containing protein n=1 Tax=Streptomyces badius TaxID=1941 RepID=A0ABQ2TC17_STRBA|nr:hypothetical protein GCM10010253_40030 [Streptomyces badius]
MLGWPSLGPGEDRGQAATDPGWQTDYRRWRPPVERAVAGLVHHGNRHLRYRGTLTNDTWHSSGSATSEQPDHDLIQLLAG